MYGYGYPRTGCAQPAFAGAAPQGYALSPYYGRQMVIGADGTVVDPNSFAEKAKAFAKASPLGVPNYAVGLGAAAVLGIWMAHSHRWI